MTHSFIAYIDESGDDGLPGHFRQPGGEGGPSHWLVIGATVWRQSRDLDMVAAAKDIIQKLPVRKRHKALHFTELDHAQRVMAVTHLASKPIRVCAVLAYKPILDNEIFCQKNQLYYYLTRYLVERLSWMCRDLRKMVPEGDGRLKIVFSRRGGMDYADFQQYLRKLKQKNDPEMKIHWPVIDIDAVEAQDHKKRYGLQLADLAVSGVRSALEYDPYGGLEPRFAEILKSRIYERGGNYLSYGAKLLPAVDQIEQFKREGLLSADLKKWREIFG